MFVRLEFLCLFVGLLLLLRGIRPASGRRALLLAASILAVAWLDWVSALALLWISWVAWFLSRRVATPAAAVAAANALAVLAYFKYAGLFADEIAQGLARWGLSASPSFLGAALPLGISFYAFQSVAYSVDVGRRRLAPEPSFASHLLAMSFFPKVAMGPIERTEKLAPQLADPGLALASDFRIGMAYLAFGLMKKLAIADHIGPYVSTVYSNPGSHGAGTLWLATAAYSLQLYCDFSGYCDMAMGTARMLGVRLAENFAQPYMAVSIKDFWRRWHISLSSWLGDYVYKPLGGRSDGLARQSLNIVLVFLVSGIWHGATWNFVIWGAMHAAMYVTFLCWRSLRPSPANPGVPRLLLAWSLTMLGVMLSRVVFRSPDLASALEAYRGMFGAMGKLHVDPAMAAALPAALVLVAYELTGGRAAPALSERLGGRPLSVQWSFVLLVLLIALGLQSKEGANFIYFRF